MKIKEIKQIPGSQYYVSLTDKILVNIKNEGDVFIDTLIFNYSNNICTLYEIFISNEDCEKFKYFCYDLKSVTFRDTNANSINKWFNIEVKNNNIIPLSYFKLNNVYHRVSSIKDILNLRNTLTANDFSILLKNVTYKIDRKLEGDNGFADDEFDIVTNNLDDFRNSDISFGDFLNHIYSIYNLEK